MRSLFKTVLVKKPSSFSLSIYLVSGIIGPDLESLTVATFAELAASVALVSVAASTYVSIGL